MILLMRLLPYVLAAATIAAVLTFTYQEGAESERLKWVQKERKEQLQINEVREKAIQATNEENERQKEDLNNVINNLVVKNEKLNRDIVASRSDGLFIDRKAICSDGMPEKAKNPGGNGEKPRESLTVRLPEQIEHNLRADYENAAKLTVECGILLDYAKAFFEVE